MSSTGSSVSSSTPLASWFRSTFEALYTPLSDSTSSPDSHLSNLLSQTFSTASEQYLNHERVSLDDLSKNIWEGNALLAGATVDWRELIEVPGTPAAEPNGEKEAGIIAGFFVVTRSSHIRIRVGPAQRLNYNSFSAKVVSPPSSTPQNPQYRISQLFITSLDEAAPIHLEGFAPHPQKAKSAETRQ
ncbi:hypothetical protein CVT24_003851 [Panaeolus cyanescens]|uniref:Uncharacterized protein n=1 Tax=Panaeolus cyanescens TaxID=181874 RepID=A0A409WNC0_9AGAR|nr:hypothetical protein CVT24_003851 [Panaeolus cyanescens]